MTVNASKLSSARDRLGLKNIEIAEALGVSEATVSRWMTGERTPLMKHLRLLADILREQVGNLTDDSGPAKTGLRQAIDNELDGLGEAQQQVILALLAGMKPPKR